MKKSLASRLDRHFTAMSALAAAAAIGGAVRPAEAGIVYSGPVNINIPSTTAGVYLNVVTGVFNIAPASAPGWDVDPWSTTSLNMFAPTAGAGPGGHVGGATTYYNLTPGTLISAASTFSGTGTATIDGSTPLNLNSSNNLVGFRFQNEANGNAVHYGWMRISLACSPEAQPRAIVEYAYEDVAGTGIEAGATANDPNAGACCKPDGTCTSVIQATCLGLGGTFTSPGTTCAAAGCPTRCCFSDGTCQMLSPTACASGGGNSSAGASCAAACPGPGACCFPNGGGCTFVTAATCTAGGGIFGGDGVPCAAFCGVAAISENFDATAPGSLPAGWSTAVTGAGGTPWTTVTTSSHSGANSAFTNDPATAATQRLDSPVLLATGPVTIDLWARHTTEVSFDAWMVQASVNGGPFTNVGQAAWRLNEYNAFLTTTGNPPFTNQRCFSGVYDWTQRTASIPANNGDLVQLRFLEGSDTSVADVGTWLDDISVTSAATGACCKPDGTCVTATVADCTTVHGGTFNSAASCGSAVCAKVAYAEVEPNETKATATPVTLANPGDYIQGNSTGAATTAGATSLDQFLVRTPAAPLGIYRNRLTITTNPPPQEGHTGSIRGLNQTAVAAAPWEPAHAVGTAGTTDSAVQTSSAVSSAPPRMNQWYGFGKQEQVYYRVTGVAATTADYKATWTTAPVTPINLGPLTPGTITISSVGQGHTTDTDLWVYDANLNAIDGYGNEDASINGGHTANLTTSSFLRRDFPAGTYYVALGVANLANNKGSPSDDNSRAGLMLDFPDAVTSSVFGTTGTTGTTVTNVSFTVTDAAGTTPVAASRQGAYDLLWYKLTVGTACYANCDASTTPPVANVADFTCFLQKFAASDPYANCDGSTTPPVINVADFTCFLQKFAAGCP